MLPPQRRLIVMSGIKICGVGAFGYFRRSSEYLCDEASPEKKALMEWSVVGRAMFGEHPSQ